MTDTPTLDSAIAPESKPQKPWIDLAALYPACFNWKQPRPLKIGIFHDLRAAGHPRPAIHKALAVYCSRGRYLKALRAGMPRLDLRGQPVGTVTEEEQAQAKAKLAGTWTPPNRPASNPAPAGQPTPDLPIDAPLSEDNIVTGRLELTLKFSDLPKPMPVKSGMKIGIRTDSMLVVATLIGRLETRTLADGAAVVVLKNRALQVFEKKAKLSHP